MAATGTETSDMQASCKSTEQDQKSQHPLPPRPRVKGHGVPLLGQSIAMKHRKASPQRKQGRKKSCSSLFLHHIHPLLGFYKVILAHDAGRDTLQQRRSWAHHTHEIQQHENGTTFIKTKSAVKVGNYERVARREGGTGDGRRWRGGAARASVPKREKNLQFPIRLHINRIDTLWADHMCCLTPFKHSFPASPSPPAASSQRSLCARGGWWCSLFNAQDLRARAKGAIIFCTNPQLEISKSHLNAKSQPKKTNKKHTLFLTHRSTYCFPSGAGVGVTALRSSGL